MIRYHKVLLLRDLLSLNTLRFAFGNARNVAVFFFFLISVHRFIDVMHAFTLPVMHIAHETGMHRRQMTIS